MTPSTPAPIVTEKLLSKAEIKPFTAAYGEGVVALILPIQQQEFGMPVKLEDQPDLLDIPGFYQRGKGNFWVALADNRVVGSIALIDIGHGRAALRKMFVAQSHRGNHGSDRAGVAQRLLNGLLQWSRAQDIKEIYLGTTASFLAAHRFYEKNDFTLVEQADLPVEFPVMKVDSRFYVYRFA